MDKSDTHQHDVRMTPNCRTTSPAPSDGRRSAPAAERNVGPIVQALRKRLPSQGRVLEVASGTGQHAAAFAAAFPSLTWQPSDADSAQLASIDAWREHVGLGNLAPPLNIDVSAPWPKAALGVDVVLTVNLLHLIPEHAVKNLFGHAQTALNEKGRIIVYGPFLRGSSYASEGDRAFDAALRARDPAVGYKSVEAVFDCADAAGFVHVATDDMPANNLLLTFSAN